MGSKEMQPVALLFCPFAGTRVTPMFRRTRSAARPREEAILGSPQER